MIQPLLMATTVLALVASGGTLVCVIRDRLPGWYVVGALGVLELALLVVCVTGLVQLATTDHQVDGATFAGYLLAMLVLVPAGALWALVERTRFGTAVIILACLSIPVMTMRAQQIWDATHV